MAFFDKSAINGLIYLFSQRIYQRLVLAELLLFPSVRIINFAKQFFSVKAAVIWKPINRFL